MSQPSAILAQYRDQPDLAAFSSVSWNEQLNYHIAKAIKTKYSDCVIVFGGPNVPMPPQHSVVDWMAAHPFVDVAVRAEGEEAFVEILNRLLETREFADIPGVAFRRGNGAVEFCDQQRPFNRNLSEFPSPYLEGLYDDLVARQSPGKQQWQAIIETNRGCPFPCTFCYWGRGGLGRKYKYHDMDRVLAEIEWMGRNKIKYVFNADSNFGVNRRDHEIADFIVATKKRYGFPEKFRTCFGKNTDEKIFQIGALLHANELEKGITLARQSNDETTLKNIRRENIKMATYRNLQRRFNDQNIPVYGELILGLPGETVDSWMRGVDELLEAGTRNQLFVYPCQVFANTEMAEPDYLRKFEIRTKRIKLAEIHGTARPAEWVTEYEDIVVSTYSMSIDDWRRMLRFSYVLMLFHSLKLAYHLMIYLLDDYGLKMSTFLEYVSDRKFKAQAPLFRAEVDFYDAVIDRMLNEGEHRGTVLADYSDFYWDVEEASFLRLTQPREQGWNADLYEQLKEIAVDFLHEGGRDLSTEERDLKLREVMLYAQCRIPSQSQLELEGVQEKERFFNYNVPEYFDKRFSTKPVALQRKPQVMRLCYGSYENDKRKFARETILWGRKSGTMLVQHHYRDAGDLDRRPSRRSD
jgi:putative methyltransferase